MSKTYLSYKEGKKSFALKGVWLLIVLAVIFGAILLRFAFSDSSFDFASHPPGSEDAYTVAKQFVKPTLKSLQITFPETEFQCSQKTDSVFVIRSYAETKDKSGEKNTTSYEITLKFYGGTASDKNNWKVINLTEN